MPVVSVTLDETNRSILSSVFYKVVEDIASAIKLPKDIISIHYRDTEVSLTDARGNTSINDTINTPTTTTRRRIQATIKEDYDEEALTTTAVHQNEYFPIFADPDISVEIAPIYIQTEVEIEFNYITPSYAEITRIRDDIRLRLSQTRDINHHQVEYNIILPKVAEDLIADVHELKSRLVPQPLAEYFLEHSTNRLHPLTDMSNQSNVRLAVQEKQIRVIGSYNFRPVPDKPEKETENASYRLSFTYSFSISLPKAMSLRYPVMVCNNTLPSKYLSFIEQHRIHLQREYKLNKNYIGQSLANLSHFEANRQLENRVDINVPINVPLFDEFALRQGHKGYGNLISFLPVVDETDGRTLFNLKDLDSYYIPKVLLDYLAQGERRYVTTPYASFIYLGLHQEGRYFDNPLLEIDSELNVKSKVALNLLKPVRVTIAISIDYSLLNPAFFERIRQNKEIVLLYLSEHISGVNTFKNELSRSVYEDKSFYRYLIELFDTYHQQDDDKMVDDIMTIIEQDQYTASVVGKLLAQGYPDLLNKINRPVPVKIDSYTGAISKVSLTETQKLKDPLNPLSRSITLPNRLPEPPLKPSRYYVNRAMVKTQMHTAVIALRQEN